MVQESRKFVKQAKKSPGQGLGWDANYTFSRIRALRPRKLRR